MISDLIVTFDNVGWSGDLRLIPSFSNCTAKICGSFQWFKKISGDLRWCQAWVSLSIRWCGDNVGWSQVISADLKWSGTISCVPRWSQALSCILNCTAKICGYFRWFQKIWGDLRWCQVMPGSIIKYQMIWGDLSWNEVILGDLSWSQLISSDHGTMSGDHRWSQGSPKCCRTALATIWGYFQWFKKIWGDLR